MKRFYFLLPVALLLSACDNKFFYPNEATGPAYASGGSASADGNGKSRAPLDVPPELQAELEVPMSGEVASRADEAVLPREYQDAVAGKAVSLDAKVYRVDASKVFSAVVDAMTSMNVPVESVDSPSGVITSDWVRRGSNTSSMFDMFGMNTQNAPTRHRYIVRVYRAKLAGAEATKLEIRVHGQRGESGRWVNRPFKKDVANEMFVAVEEQLSRMKRGVTGEETGDVVPEAVGQ